MPYGKLFPIGHILMFDLLVNLDKSKKESGG
jgi:hypothetical protein